MQREETRADEPNEPLNCSDDQKNKCHNISPSCSVLVVLRPWSLLEVFNGWWYKPTEIIAGPPTYDLAPLYGLCYEDLYAHFPHFE